MRIPATLDECFEVLKQELPKEDLTELPKLTQQKLCRLHSGLGRWIRNNWKLWEDGPLKEHFLQMGIEHPDDISGIVITSFWHHLRNEPLELEAQIKFYQDFWKKPENQ